MLAHTWQPITGLETEHLDIDFEEIDALQAQWSTYRRRREDDDPDAYKAFVERVHRRWAIETGIIEGIYNIDRGTTQTLVEKGLTAEFIEFGATDRDPRDLIAVLHDHRDTAEFVTDVIRQQMPLSVHYIRQLHQILLRNQETYIAYDQFERPIETPLDRGGFKSLPNNPTRTDGLVHEYCPPIQVESELDNLIGKYGHYQSSIGQFHPLLTAAWLHHRFTQIHPFQDGNGRVARALLTWHLVRENYLPIIISRDGKDRYIDALESADSGDLNPFVGFIVRLQREIILEALGEPVTAQVPNVFTQVLDNIAERVESRFERDRRLLRSVNQVAIALRDSTEVDLENRASEIVCRLNESGLSVNATTERGGPENDKGHWYQYQVLQTAKDAQHWVNLNEDKFFAKLSINPEDRSRAPRLVFVVSLHHVGRQLTGIMAATAFAQIFGLGTSSSEDQEEPNTPDFKNCTIEPFTFTAVQDVQGKTRRFEQWVQESLTVALAYWGEYLS